MRSPNVWRAASDVLSDGYALVAPEVLDARKLHDSWIVERAFHLSQDQDPMPGDRWRSYASFLLEGSRLTPLPHAPYVQTKEYNPVDGDKQRVFRPIDDEVLETSTLLEIISLHVAIAKCATPSAFGEQTLVGLHMVSYRPKLVASYSSPPGLHRDQEDYVAVVMFGSSQNLLGGENVIASGSGLDTRFGLDQPFQSLVLTKGPKHAVLPMVSSDGQRAYRNVLLVTFSPR
jgi:hypothetical protein